MSLLIAGGRLLIPGHDLSWPGTYEAFAHIWVGALLVLACQKNRPVLWWLVGPGPAAARAAVATGERNKPALWWLVGITALEVVMGLTR